MDLKLGVTSTLEVVTNYNFYNYYKKLSWKFIYREKAVIISELATSIIERLAIY